VPRSHALLAGLFDYAGLFPPASLSLDDAMANYARYRACRHGWMLGRFIVPASQLDDVTATFANIPDGTGSVPWLLSALGGPDPQADAAHVAAFNGHHANAANRAAIVDTIEVKATVVDEVRAARLWASRGFEVYCEVPLGPDMGRLLDAVARGGLHAKIRTGGPTPDSIPSYDDVAAFLCGCVARGVVAKAVDLLWDQLDELKRIDIVYICSNLEIAAQNVNRLRLGPEAQFALPTRLTLLPRTLHALKKQPVKDEEQKIRELLQKVS